MTENALKNSHNLRSVVLDEFKEIKSKLIFFYSK